MIQEHTVRITGLLDAAIAAYEAGGYNFDPVTPEEHGYTDVGWYGCIAPEKAEGTLVSVTITGNQGISYMEIEVQSPYQAAILAGDAIISAEESFSDGTWNYRLVYQKETDFLKDGILFSLKFDRPVSETEVVVTCDHVLDRIGHPTKLRLAGEELEPLPMLLPF